MKWISSECIFFSFLLDNKRNHILNILYNNKTLFQMSKTKLWGPSAWNFLFAVALGYDLNDDYKSAVQKERIYRSFFACVPNILPCVYCRQSARKSFRKRKVSAYIKKYSRFPLIRLVYDLKDDVNRKLIKQESQLEKKHQGKKYKKGSRTKSSPPFTKVLKRILAMRATTCSSRSGK